MIHTYMEEIERLIKQVTKKEAKSMEQAAKQIATVLQADGVLHLFGSGHSHILAEELYYRAGGLVPVNPILHEPLMLHEGPLKSSEMERKKEYAKEFMAEQDIRPGDVLMVISTSGRNAVPVDVALLGKEKRAFIIAVTSTMYSQSQPSRHSSGRRLYEVADLVLDTHIPVGDALMSHNHVDVHFAPGSTVIGAAMLNAVVADTISRMAEAGVEPPIFLSANVKGGDERNRLLIEKYGGRVNM